MLRLTQNHGPAEGWIVIGHVGIIRIAGPGDVRADLGREGKAALGIDDSVPLPAANEFVHQAAGAAGEPLPLSEWQLVGEIRVELVPETEGRDSPAEGEFEGIQDRLRLIRSGVGRAGRVVIDRLPEGVVGLECQAAAGALDEGDVH